MHTLFHVLALPVAAELRAAAAEVHGHGFVIFVWTTAAAALGSKETTTSMVVGGLVLSCGQL